MTDKKINVDYSEHATSSENLLASSRSSLSATIETRSGLSVALPCTPQTSLTPLEVESRLSGKESPCPSIYTKPLEDTDGDMVGRMSKVYATSDSAAASLEQFRLHLQGGGSSEPVEMGDPPAPQEIAMANISPRHDDRQEQSDTLNRTLHQVRMVLVCND